MALDLSILNGLTAADLDALLITLDRDQCPRSFYKFVRQGWSAVYNEPFVDGWHIAALCYHLQALYEGQFKTLIFSMPPGCGKSRTSSVMFSAWCFLRDATAGQWFASFGDDLCERDSMDTRRLIKSKWFRERWGSLFTVREDEDTKMLYRNDRGGWRLAASIGGSRGFGEHPAIIGIDDCLSPKKAESFAEREAVKDYLRNVISTRGVVRGVRKFLGGQRLHEQDGHACLLEQEPDAVQLVLPMWYEPERKCRTNIRYTDLDAATPEGKYVIRESWEDPRTEAGQLLWPEGMDEAKVQILKNGLRRAHAIAGQLQQRPTSPEGDMFLVDWFKNLVDSAPKNFPAGRAWDLASATGTRSDETAGVLATFDGEYLYICHACWGKVKRAERNVLIRKTAESDAELYGDYCIRFEQEGGSGGKDAAEMMAEDLSDQFRVYIDKPMGKPTPQDQSLKGWETWADLLSRGRVRLVRGPWLEKFVEQHLAAPAGQHDDLIDAVSRVGRSLYRKSKVSKLNRPLLLVTDDEERQLSSAAVDTAFEISPMDDLSSIFDHACHQDGLELGVRW